MKDSPWRRAKPVRRDEEVTLKMMASGRALRAIINGDGV